MHLAQTEAQERRRGLLRLLVITIGLGSIYAVIPLQNDVWWLGLVVGLVAILAIMPVTVHRVNTIGTSTQPILAAAEAVLIVVAMLVFAFSSVYLTIDRRSGQFVGLDTKIDAVYFTVTTLSTVGYGDVHASGQAARLAVTLQIALDLSLLAVAVRVLIGAARRRTHPTDPGA